MQSAKGVAPALDTEFQADSGRSSSGRSVTRKAQVDYLADLLPQLRLMALHLDARDLARILELAESEAKILSQFEAFREELRK